MSFKQVGRYWWHVTKRAWRETSSDLLKAFIRLLVTSGGLAVVVFLGTATVGMDRWWLVASPFAAAILLILWKLISIPAKLHEWQRERQAACSVAVQLEALYKKGATLLVDTGIEGQPWLKSERDWEEEVSAVLTRFDESERLMFETLTLPDSPGPVTLMAMPVRPGQTRLSQKLFKLRRITQRAYQKAQAEDASLPSPLEDDEEAPIHP